MKLSVSKEKKKTWAVFSKYIRMRDAKLTTDTLTKAKCVSCQKVYPIKNLQAGHFVSRTHTSVLFDEQNVHAQCVGCNMFKQGNFAGYLEEMRRLYGETVIDRILSTRFDIKRFKASELVEMREEYKQKIKEMEA